MHSCLASFRLGCESFEANDHRQRVILDIHTRISRYSP